MATKTEVKSDPFENDAPVTFAGRTRATDLVKFGDLTKMEEVAGQDLLLHSITPVQTDFGGAVKLECSAADGTKHSIITSGQVIYTKLLELAAMEAQGTVEFPIVVCFNKRGRAWVID